MHAIRMMCLVVQHNITLKLNGSSNILSLMQGLSSKRSTMFVNNLNTKNVQKHAFYKGRDFHNLGRKKMWKIHTFLCNMIIDHIPNQVIVRGNRTQEPTPL